VWAINVVVVDVLGEESMQVTIALSRHSVRIERTRRSPMAFARGSLDRCPDAGDAQLRQADASTTATPSRSHVLELVAEDQVFECDVTVRLQACQDGAKKEQKEHASG